MSTPIGALTAETEAAGADHAEAGRGMARLPVRSRPLRRVVRRYQLVGVGGAILLLLLLLAVFAPSLTVYDPRSIDLANRLLPWSAAHPLGTDQLGRDVFARIIYGARISLLVGCTTAILSSLFGLMIGMVSTTSKLADMIVMRVLDGVMSIPAVLLAIALMAIAGGSARNVIIAVTVVETPRCARLVRGLMLSLRERAYVEAAIAAGSGRVRVLLKHMLPNLMAPLIVQATFIWSVAMLIESALSFIGAGVPASTPTWGNMIAESKVIWQLRPSLIFLPSAALVISILGVNLLGEGLRRLFDIKRN